nr:NADH dehydrogenase subunit 4L [Exechonella vieirai]
MTTQTMILTTIPTSVTLVSLMSVMFQRKKMLTAILSLELTLLSLFSLMVMMSMMKTQNISPAFFILVMGAIEASLALSLLINLTRFKGSDMLNNSTSYKS